MLTSLNDHIKVFETFGPVTRPLYAVRYNDASEIDQQRAVVGAKVYYVTNHSKFVLTNALKGIKGSDASNRWDEEVDENVNSCSLSFDGYCCY